MTTIIQGPPCRKCGSPDRYASRACIPCAREAQRRRRANNPEYDARWRMEHAAEKSAANLRWRNKNLDEVREKNRVYARNRYLENPEASREVARKWRESNREKHRASTKTSTPEWHHNYYLQNREAHLRVTRGYKREKRQAKQMSIALLQFSNMIKDAANA